MTKVPLQERKLNPEQRKAVEFGGGPLLIIAGAGTGKTTVVTERIKHLVIKDLARPAEILALTFTEKASREMETRVDEVLPYGYTQMWISTFHAFCDRILRQEAVHIGLSPAYRLLSDTDAMIMMRKYLFEFDLDYFRPLGNPTKFIGGLLQHFSRLQDEDVSPKQYIAWVNSKFQIPNSKNNPSFTSPLSKGRKGGVDEEEFLELKKYAELAKAYQKYEALKIKENVMDFADLITQTLVLFRNRPNVLETYRKQFKYMLVDEFQDTNTAQYELIKLLAPPKLKPNLTVVGDDNQSVYKFRGAAVSNIIYFKEDYQSATQIVLNKNYRSYQYILDKAHQLIKHNDPDTLEAKLGISKKLTSTRKTSQKLDVQFIHADRVENEAEKVAKTIKELAVGSSQLAKENENKYLWKDFAILVRANNHAESFVRALTRYGIPYQFLGPEQLFRQSEIKDLISYLQVLQNFNDDIALFRVLAMEIFDISIRDLTAILNMAKKYDLSFFESCEVVVGQQAFPKVMVPFIAAQTKEKLSAFLDMFNRHLHLVLKESAGQLLYFFLEDTGILKKVVNFELPLTQQKAENITKFFNRLKSYETEHADASVGAVLDWLLLAMELGESPLAADMDWTENDAVNILTVHSAKGLEFPVVFLVNLVAQRFPTTERREQIPISDALIKEILPVGDAHIEEERRLFYVGMTRARDLLYLTAANYYGEGKRVKKISQFVEETLGAISSKNITKAEQQLSLLDWQKEEMPQKVKQTTQLKINYISYSQIETFRTCPLHYKLKYMIKVPTPPSAALSFGTSVHAALRDFYILVKQGEVPSQNQLHDLYAKNWLKEGYKEKRYETAMFKKGEQFLKTYYTQEFNPKVKVLALEQPFTVPIKNDTRFVKAGGRIDRVDDVGNGQIEIIDYKTGRLPSKREIDANLQLSIYALAASEILAPPFARDIEKVKLTLYYFDTQEKISTTRTSEQLIAEKKRILELVHEIETSDFTCSGNKLCTNCEYKLFCGV